jgi:hypothetical protein
MFEFQHVQLNFVITVMNTFGVYESIKITDQLGDYQQVKDDTVRWNRFNKFSSNSL